MQPPFNRRKILASSLQSLVLLSVWAVHAATTDDMVIYADRFHNGWGDNWSYTTRYATNNPVHAGSNSMAILPSATWEAWWLKAGTKVDTTIYTNLTLWVYGTTSGQNIKVYSELDGNNAGLPSVTVSITANAWQQIAIPLTSLGVSNKTNLTGFRIEAGNGIQPRFIDDVRLVAKPTPATVNVSVNANQTVRKVDGKIFGINQVAWDGSVNTPASASILNDVGSTILRWPGGSWGDGYHWTNENWSAGSSGPRYWGSFSSDFIKLATNTQSDAFIIVNYGTSTPEEAAYGVRLFNITNNCNFKYWEVGNEIGGSWEWDWRYPEFKTNDILNLPSFAAKIKTPPDNVSTYLRSQLSADTLSKVDAYVANPSANNAYTVRLALVNDINNLMYNSSQSIYKPDTNRFAGVTFRSVTWTNLALPIPPLGQDLNNRMVLEDAYPELAKITPEINLASNWPNVDLPHDAWTYAKRFTNYYAQMKAVDPTIKVGALADVFEDGTQNYTNHPVVNPRTGQTQTGWNPIMLTFLRNANCIPDFLIVHDYGPTAGDTQDLLYSRVWATYSASLRQQLTDYLGDAGTNVTLEVTESGMGGDKQSSSLVGGLFYAESIGQILQTEFNSRMWWNMRNGGNAIGNSDPEMYGWRKDANGNYTSDAGIITGAGGGSNSFPTYYAGKLLTRFAKDGDTVVAATSDYQLLSTYAVKRTNGTLTLLVINKSCVSNLTANFNVSGYTPFTNATIYSYGIPQDEAARTGIGSMDIQTRTTNFQSLSFNFAPFSMSVVELSSGNQPPLAPANLTATPSNAAVALTWFAANGASSYILKRSTTSGSGYAPLASGLTATNYLDTAVTNGTTYYYVMAATNNHGASADTAQVSATPSDTKALYAFEGNAQDTSGSGNHGTATALSYVAGKVGSQAAQFNGTSSYVSIPRSVTDDFTVAMWVKTTDTAGTAGAQWWNGKGLVDGEVGGGGADWGTAIVNGKFALGVGSAGGDTTIASSVNINDGTWHHVAATRDNTSGAMAVYVDGVLRGSGTGPTGSRTFPPSLRIGSLQTGNNFLNGTLDDVRLYDRVLSATEMAALMNTPPVFVAITNRTVNVGQTVAFTASATDADVPPQTLTFAMLVGATNATLNTSNGAFSFRPVVTQADSTNQFTLKVSDNGTPSLSATQNFAVMVNPLVAPSVSNVSGAGGQFSFNISGQSGPDYAVESSTNLTQWSTVLITNSPAVPFDWTDTNSAAPMRFYRVKLGPPLP